MKIGPYTLVERIAQGSMGEVWRATHGPHEHPVAVKFITPAQASQTSYRRHFYNEIRSAAALHHPGIIQIYDYGKVDEDAELDAADVSTDTPYFAMEFAEGGSLEELDPRPDWAQLRSLLVELLRAIGHAHARDVIHRDLKPSNILRGSTRSGGRFKVSDFGLAFHRERADLDDSGERGTVGTPLYMAPEQFRARWRDLGPWTDLYGFGCLAWRLATGKPPFPGEDFFEISQDHISKPLPDFEPVVDVPAEFAPWLARLLEKHPIDRFRRAADARWALLNMPDTPDRRTLPGPPRTSFESQPSSNEIAPLEPLARVEASSPRYNVRMPELPDENSFGTGARSPRTIEPKRRVPPPLPESWSERSPPPLETPRMSVGLELFTLREIPTVGREPERSRLWQSLRSVVDEQRSRLILLEGDAGVGKTRLARWIREYAEEIGAAEGMVASHSRRKSESDGFPGMLTSFFDVSGLDRSDAADRIERWYRARGVERPYEWHAMAELTQGDAAPDARSHRKDDGSDDSGAREREQPRGGRSADPSRGPDDTRPGFDNPIPEATALSNAREVRALIRRFFKYASLERPQIVHLDDLQWGLETLHFLKSYFESRKSTRLPILFVGTVREDALVRRPLEGRLIAEIRERDVVETVEVGPMPSEDQRRLVEELLYLAPDAAHRVAEHSGGNPLYAVELVRDWVDRSLLEPSSEGFRLTEEAEPTIPENLYDVWKGRLDDMIDEGGDDLELALQLGATFGMTVDEKEWRAACDRVDVAFPARLIQTLLRRRLLRETDSGWRFAHNMLRRTLIRDADRAGDWQRLNAVCAEVLAAKPDPSDERLGLFWLEAGERARAFEPLLEAAEQQDLRMKTGEARRLFEKAARCIDAVDLQERPGLDATFHLRRGRVELIDDGTPEEAEEDFRRAAELAAQVGDSELLARAQTERAHVAHQRHDYERAIELAGSAQEHLSEDRVSLVAARTAFRLADSLRRSGALDEARDAFRRAHAMARGRFPTEHHKILITWAYLHKSASELPEAREKAHRALHLVEHFSSPQPKAINYNLLADVARDQGQIEEAREWYVRAEELAVLVGHWSLFHIHLGRVQIALDDDALERAARLIENIRRRTAGRRRAWFTVCLLALGTEMHAGRGEWEAVDAKIEDLEDELSDAAPAIPDAASSLRRAALMAADADRADRARRLARAASRIWSEGEADQLADELRERDIEID